MSSPKSKSEGIGTSFASGYKSFSNDIVMFVLVMESASWFSGPRNIASAQVGWQGQLIF